MNAEIKLEPKEVENIIEDYYKKYEEQPNAKVDIVVETGSIGIGRYEEGAILKVKLKTEMAIAGTKRKATTTLANEELEAIFTQVLKESGYKIKGFKLDYGLDYEGYGSDRVAKPYFNGANIMINKAPAQVLKWKGR